MLYTIFININPYLFQEVFPMSNLMEVIKSRRSTRAFKSELPPKDQIMQIVEAAEWAPSGMGKYLWHFTVIYNAEKSLKLARAVAEADNRGPEYNSTVHRSTLSFPTSGMSTTLW
ncbi:hypothetical protein DXB00_06205 [Butyricicoccus sp. OF10-2]|nr:hypothetical protein DXB00_06205 [Butyricicoccus sp. OF10-2]